MTWRSSCAVLLALCVAVACGDDDGGGRDAGPDATPDVPDGAPVDTGPDLPPPPVIGAVPETRQVAMEGLSEPAYVVYTESHVPHVYAATRADAARVMGYVTARDRFFAMDMARRLGQGTISALFGQDGLSIDLESRQTGMTRVTDAILARLTDEQRTVFGAYAEGVSAYVAAVQGRREFPPREYQLAGPIFGVRAGQLMEPFTLKDVCAVAAVVVYELGYETYDIGHDAAARAIEAGVYTGEAFEALRDAGLRDAYSRVTNAKNYSTADGWGLDTAGTTSMAIRFPRAPALGPDPRWMPELPPDLLDRALRHAARLQRRLGKDHAEGFGSNAWAIGGGLTTDGSAVVAHEAHLGGTVPNNFYRVAIDTALLGGGDTRVVGVTIPGLPSVGIGTNGHVAWGQTQFFGDITDWYREEITLGADGLPATSTFRGAQRALVRVDESLVVADVPAFDSVGRTETWPRWETFDGRMITEIEGRSVTADEPLGAGEARINLMGDLIVPEDTDGDGVITALSFDYTGLEGPNFQLAYEHFGHARTVTEMREGVHSMVALSNNIVGGDENGSVMFTPYQAMPCRRHLARDVDGRFAPGADPRRLLDGTRFGGFDLPLAADGTVDESLVTGDENCVVPLAEYPQAEDPERGFVVSANNDPGTFNKDNDLENDPWYIGGPWHEDFRADRADEAIRAAAGSIDEDWAAALQADRVSPLGRLYVPLLLEAIAAARAAAGGSPAAGSPEERMANRWPAARTDYEEVERRIQAWADRGHLTASGVETFYDTPTADDRADAVATMIFNAWLGPFERMALGDERFPGGTFVPTGSGGRARVLTRMVEGRGAGNPLDAVEWNPLTEESVFFDVLGTDEVETAQEIALLSIDEALAFLRSEPTGPGAGGFGTDDYASWLWGMRHYARFEALIGDFIGGDESFAFVADSFSITPETLPLLPGLADDDPRAALPGFPWPGDNYTLDASNSGNNGTRFTFGGVPVYRMVMVPRGDATSARNVLLGGQSGIPGDDYFQDQAELWLRHETTPMHLTPEQVVGGATERETFYPPGA